MDVPIEVVRNGNAERYVKIQVELNEVRKQRELNTLEYDKLIRKLFEFVSTRNRYLDYQPDLWNSPETNNRWIHALSIEEYSKKLVEITGKLVENEAKEKDLINERENIL